MGETTYAKFNARTRACQPKKGQGAKGGGRKKARADKPKPGSHSPIKGRNTKSGSKRCRMQMRVANRMATGGLSIVVHVRSGMCTSCGLLCSSSDDEAAVDSAVGRRR
jgi:hypothetical protein